MRTKRKKRLNGLVWLNPRRHRSWPRLRRPESFDALLLAKRAGKAGYRVRRLEIIGPMFPGDSPCFSITFDPVMPDKRIPLERIIMKMGLEVDGGGTKLIKVGKKIEMTESDVTFQFKRTFKKTNADTACDVIRHLESEVKHLREETSVPRLPRKYRRHRRRCS